MKQNEKFTSETDLVAILLIGCLSMFFAEVVAGSSLIWIIDPWSLIVTFPLYLAHLLFFLNLAMRTKRTSIPHLYLWGVLFGLYEAWVTKVLWWGYPGSDGPILGLVGGIAILEFLVLVFFWHPLQAFVFPILIYEIFVLSENKELTIEQKVFPSHLEYINKDSKFYFIFIFTILITSVFLSASSGPNLFVADIALISSLGLIILLLFLIKKRKPKMFSVYSLKLGNKGFLLVIFYLIGLYIFTYFTFGPELIPGIIPHLIIISFYVLIGIIEYMSNPIEEIEFKDSFIIENIIVSKDIFKLLAILLIGTSIFCFVPFIIHNILYLIFTFMISGIGVILLILFLKKSLTS